MMHPTSSGEVACERQGNVLWLTLSRPAAFNAITPASIEALGRAVAQAEEDRSLRALVVTGSGAAFCAGADLKAVLAGAQGEQADLALSHFLRTVGAVFTALERLSIPTIAAVNGVAVAGGLELMLCCDVAVAAASPSLADAAATATS